MEKPTVRRAWLRPLAAVAVVLLTARCACAWTSDSPEVKQAVSRAIQFLESPKGFDSRVGAQALVALAILKNGATASHPRVTEATRAIVSTVGQVSDVTKLTLDIYSTGLSIILLTTVEPTSSNVYSPTVVKLLAYLYWRQKTHGGWGYPEQATGDTSMTQYGVLCNWEAAQAGYQVSSASIESVAFWLLRTQDPSGGFGYQGNVAPTATPVPQSDVRISLSAAGLGSTYICYDLLGFSALAKEREAKLPPALKEIRAKSSHESRLDPRLFQEVQARGNQYLASHQSPVQGPYVYYYLYALERYWSFREAAEGTHEPEPLWYNEGARFLLANQTPDGTWAAGCGAVPDTAFGILFLLRSSKKSIERARDYGAGILVGGRGLPRDAADLEVRAGKVVKKPLLGPAEHLLSSIDDAEDLNEDDPLDLLAELPVEETRSLVSRHAEKLRQLAGGGLPEARVAALHTLAKTRNLDYVPLLIYALRDPDLRVVREAEQGLRLMSRRIGGDRLPDVPSDNDRQRAIKAWKEWFLAIRPDALFED